VKISFLHPHEPSASYIYPATPHILQLRQSAILAKVTPNTATGHTYTLTTEETKLTADRSKNTSVNSTNQYERTLYFSCKLSKENFLWLNVYHPLSVYKIVLTISVAFIQIAFFLSYYIHCNILQLYT
jgi:hypothetical protein